jgi:hypothetical protein
MKKGKSIHSSPPVDNVPIYYDESVDDDDARDRHHLSHLVELRSQVASTYRRPDNIVEHRGRHQTDQRR